MKFRVIIERDEDGKFVAECPALPGCISEGRTRAEAIRNISDAVEGYLESLRKHGEPIPPPIEEVQERSFSITGAAVGVVKQGVKQGSSL